MFNNLRAVLQRKNISVKGFSEILGVSEKTAQNKLNGVTEFTYSEFKKTCLLLAEYNADYLFYQEDDKQTA